jgi:hypothetical protein
MGSIVRLTGKPQVPPFDLIFYPARAIHVHDTVLIICVFLCVLRARFGRARAVGRARRGRPAHYPVQRSSATCAPYEINNGYTNDGSLRSRAALSYPAYFSA